MEKIQKIISYFLISFLAVQFLVLSPLYAAPVIRVSTENSENHPQTQALKDFVNLANERFNGELELKLFPTGRLFRGSDVVNAVSAGRMEIAVPGIWHMTKFIPDLNLFLLPRFYGVSADENYKIRDGEIGSRLLRSIESTLNVKVLGRWIDLGYAHLFTTKKKVRKADDIKGLTIRVAGGRGNSERINALGGQAVTIPWNDFPDVLKRNEVDGTLTTAASIVSVKLWKSGIKYAYLDKQYFPQYIPLISSSIWKRLTVNQQKIMLSSWDDIVDKSRIRAKQYQEIAMEKLLENGVEFFEPDENEILRTRNNLIGIESKLIKELRVSILN